MRVLFEQDILQANASQAEANHREFGPTLVVNLIGSPGCGKTTILEKTIDKLAGEFRMAVIEGYIYTSKDAERIERHDVPVIQCNTAGGCHLSAEIIAQAAVELRQAGQFSQAGQLSQADQSDSGFDILFIENVGNLVCPAEFDLGEDHKVAVLSIVEGDDKPAKYPLLFQEAGIVILNKCDFLELSNFNMESAETDIRGLNRDAEILHMAAYKEEGLEPWIDWLRAEVKKKR